MVRRLPRIDRFGLGDRWPRPEQAAAGALDRLPPDHWPVLVGEEFVARCRKAVDVVQHDLDATGSADTGP